MGGGGSGGIVSSGDGCGFDSCEDDGSRGRGGGGGGEGGGKGGDGDGSLVQLWYL